MSESTLEKAKSQTISHQKKKPLGNFAADVRVELGRVDWPSRAQVVRMANMVLVVLVFFMVLVGALDFGLSKVVRFMTDLRNV